VVASFEAELDLVCLMKPHDEIYARHHEQGGDRQSDQAAPLAGPVLLIILVVGHGR